MGDAREEASGSTPTNVPELRPALILDPGIVLTYQALIAKWVASRALLWQFPALTLTAQAFLISAALQFQNGSLLDRILLSVVVVSIGAASILIQLKAGHEQHLDLVMIDLLEKEVLTTRPDLRLRHSDTLDGRINWLVPILTDELRENYLWRFSGRGRWPRLGVRISFTWTAMQALVSVVGAAVGLIR